MQKDSSLAGMHQRFTHDERGNTSELTDNLGLLFMSLLTLISRALSHLNWVNSLIHVGLEWSCKRTGLEEQAAKKVIPLVDPYSFLLRSFSANLSGPGPVTSSRVEAT